MINDMANYSFDCAHMAWINKGVAHPPPNFQRSWQFFPQRYSVIELGDHLGARKCKFASQSHRSCRTPSASRGRRGVRRRLIERATAFVALA